jgi:sugar phosphate isomerase/epimerase
MVELPRRSFLWSLAGAVSSAALSRAAGSSARLPLCFSTLGCPAWPWSKIVGEAERLGFAAFELRGLMGEMDLTQRPELSGSGLAASRRDLATAGLRIASLDASARMHEAEPSVRAAQLDEGRRFIDLARSLDCPYVRVFGDRIPPEEPREAVLDRIASGFVVLADHARGSGVSVIWETHGDFIRSELVKEVLARIGRDEVGLLWDAHHTVAVGGETPAHTFSQIGRFVRHTHLKDSVPDGDERRYVLTGKGQIPVEETVRVLAQGGYRGYYSFEWEKAWHPELDEPEVALPHYAEVMSGYLRAAGVSG